MAASLEVTSRTFETSLGSIPVTGWFGRPLSVLAITGAFATRDSMSMLPNTLAPRYGGLVAHLPGNHSPRLSETSISAYARAFDEVIDQIGPTLVLGESVGGLVGLAMRSPNLKRVVAIDPPLATAKLWQLIPRFRAALPAHRWFIEPIFGVYDDRVEERGYAALLDGLTVPVDAVVGEDPLFPERTVDRTPSLVDAPERARLAAHPLVTLSVAPGAGHNVPRQSALYLRDVLLAACGKAEAA